MTRQKVWNHYNRRFAVLRRDNYRCLKCGWQRQIEYSWGATSFDDTGLEAAHIIARRFGGSDGLENAATLCTDCHTEWHRAEKAGEVFEDWLKVPKAPVRPVCRRGRPFNTPNLGK